MDAPRLVLLAADLEDLIFPAVVILFLLISALGQVLAKVREAQRIEDARRRGPGGARPAQQPGASPSRGLASRSAFPRQGPAKRPVEAKPVVPVVVAEDASVAEHVRTYVPAQEFGTMHSDVASRRTGSEDVMRDHVHDAFDHDLGELGGSPGESAEAVQAEEPGAPDDRVSPVPVTAAAGLAALLADADSLRQAIVLNEIFQRPEHRWR